MLDTGPVRSQNSATNQSNSLFSFTEEVEILSKYND
jgi:hypothetical protein